MANKNCLNCNKELTDKYCAGCGQKADTHRITFKRFIFHDVLHGTFHVEKGMLYTAKQAILRPGKAAIDYISGKRQPFYNVFYLNLIIIGLILFLRHYYVEIPTDSSDEIPQNREYINEASKSMDEIFSHKSKLIIFLFVPFAALNSFLLFKRKKFNLSEHSIIAGMILLGMLLTSVFGNLFFYLSIFYPFSSAFADFISYFITTLIILQIGYGYINAFGSDYSKLGVSYRVLLFYVLLCIEIVILFLIVFGFVSDWKFGKLNFSPFG